MMDNVSPSPLGLDPIKAKEPQVTIAIRNGHIDTSLCLMSSKDRYDNIMIATILFTWSNKSFNTRIP